jgi:enamine deaminase RidA (YjgF/YER057c/UK114 family)
LNAPRLPGLECAELVIDFGLVGTGGQKMTIQRIGSTEGLKDVFGVKVLPVISLVVVHNGIVSTCGVTAEPTGDVKVQTKRVLASIDGLLEKAGTNKSKLLSAYVWLADMQDFEEHNSVWNEWVDRQNPPVRFCVQSALWRPNILVEIMVTAAQ